jgi:hypothetical protein
MSIETISTYLGYGAIALASISVAVATAAALRSGVIKAITLGPLSIEGGITSSQVSQQRDIPTVERPFETEALASYYNQALARSKVSFWFSLIFASVGFLVIIFAFVTHDASDLAGTVIKIVSGVVIDAVSGLFFVQSTSAQKSMSEFFEKLRLDRASSVAREMISEMENVERRDQLRAQLVIKYAGIDKFVVGS